MAHDNNPQRHFSQHIGLFVIFVGIFEYNPNQNLKFDYDFSIKNNMSDKNYELYGFEFYLKNLTTRFEYFAALI